MSIQLNEKINRLARQLAAAEERIKALEAKAAAHTETIAVDPSGREIVEAQRALAAKASRSKRTQAEG